MRLQAPPSALKRPDAPKRPKASQNGLKRPRAPYNPKAAKPYSVGLQGLFTARSKVSGLL
eukprot:3281186-Alexandrium_andersonii.AAC.1